MPAPIAEPAPAKKPLSLAGVKSAGKSATGSKASSHWDCELFDASGDWREFKVQKRQRQRIISAFVLELGGALLNVSPGA